jgi:hypothetical protein
MSFILLIDIGKSDVRISSLHYRDAILFLGLLVSGERIALEKNPVPESLDAGYLLVDRDHNIIVSRQDCFHIQDIVPPHLNWNVIDLNR